MKRKPLQPGPAPASVLVCILAGGRSVRMGRDKARLRLGSRSMLGQIRAAASELGFPVRVLRRDLVPRCGPLGGICTALKETRAGRVLFLACDMPFVPPALMRGLVRQLGRAKAVFSELGNRAGFPFALRRDTLAAVEAQIAAREFSLQALARRLRAKRHHPRDSRQTLFNVNTPADWQRAQEKIGRSD